MIPKVGEVYMLDLGYEGKVRPVVIMSREDANPPRALSLFVPLTKQSRNSPYEVQMPCVPWLKLQSYANVQAISWAEHHELTDKRGKFDASAIRAIREAICFIFELD